MTFSSPALGWRLGRNFGVLSAVLCSSPTAWYAAIRGLIPDFFVLPVCLFLANVRKLSHRSFIHLIDPFPSLCTGASVSGRCSTFSLTQNVYRGLVYCAVSPQSATHNRVCKFVVFSFVVPGSLTGGFLLCLLNSPPMEPPEAIKNMGVR